MIGTRCSPAAGLVRRPTVTMLVRLLHATLTVLDESSTTVRSPLSFLRKKLLETVVARVGRSVVLRERSVRVAHDRSRRHRAGRQPPERAITSSSSGTVRSCSSASASSRKPAGSDDLDRPVGVAAADPLAALDHRQRRVELGDEVVELGERRDLREPPAHLAADRVAGEVPRGVLAERPHRDRSPPSSSWWSASARAWSTITAAANAERTRRRRRTAGEHLEQVAEQPRPAEAAAADDDAVAARLVASSPTASAASQMSPLPSTGIDVTCALSSPIASQRASPA